MIAGLLVYGVAVTLTCHSNLGQQLRCCPSVTVALRIQETRQRFSIPAWVGEPVFPFRGLR